MKLSIIFRPANRSLIRELVTSDFKLRYQNSILGYFWSLLRPLFLFGVLYVVFTKVIRVGEAVPYYPAYLLLGLVLWTFFIEATLSGMNAITGRGDLIRKVSIPKYIIVLSTNISALVNFTFNMMIVFIFMILSDVPFRWTILAAPLFIIELVVLTLALSYLLSALFVKFRDFSHIWDVVLQVLFYAVPILYTLTFPPKWIAQIISINPLTQIFQDVRALMITPEVLTTQELFGSQLGRIIPMLIIVIISVVAVWYFRRSSHNFAEEL
ncbi:MAG TPA: ABC transporter permease [Candidatus Saccharimonadales bacterium]|nr:ABC transporter permease [Candidatus Saccharimonadales bacterium]